MSAQEQRLVESFGAGETRALSIWLDAQPWIAGSAEQTAEGRAAFEAAGCARCYGGDSLYDGASHDVGAGSFQTPRLRGVSLRAPYFADGCAPTRQVALDGTCRPLALHGIASAEARASAIVYLRSL